MQLQISKKNPKKFVLELNRASLKSKASTNEQDLCEFELKLRTNEL